MPTPGTLKFQGCSLFRQRVAVALLTNKALKIEKIRNKEGVDSGTGLQDFEASFLRLVEQLTDGTHIEINETGTTLRMKPGVLVGGSGSSSTRPIVHDCGTHRSIGWFIEGILPIALFSKAPVYLQLTGLTNDELDWSVDMLKMVTLPLLKNFNIWGIKLEVKRRGARPKGGGLVELFVPPVRTALAPINVTDEGLVRRIRGVAFSTKVSPQIANRAIQSCREVLNHILPDVHIDADTYKGKLGGDSPGYSVCLVAESTTGVLLSAERTAARAPANPTTTTVPAIAIANSANSTNSTSSSSSSSSSSSAEEVPEEVGREAAMMLLQAVRQGGVVDSHHQPLVLLLMALTPEDVSKVRFGRLAPQSVLTLRLLRSAFGTTFKIKSDVAAGTSATATLGAKRGLFADGGGSIHGEQQIQEAEEAEDGVDGVDGVQQGLIGSKSIMGWGAGAGSWKRPRTTLTSTSGPTISSSSSNNNNSNNNNNNNNGDSSSSLLLSCYGIGYSNVNRRVT